MAISLQHDLQNYPCSPFEKGHFEKKHYGLGLSESCKMSAIYFYLWQLLDVPTLKIYGVSKKSYKLTILQ